MKVLGVCTNYFNGFEDIASWKKNNTKTNTLAVLKIISYFTAVIPLSFAVLFTAASLSGRASTIGPLSPQDSTIINQAGKKITKKVKPQATPQEIRDAAKKAAKGKVIHTAGPSGHSYQTLLDMVNSASIKEISYIIEGALNCKYSTGIKKALGELLRRRDCGTSSDKEKLKLSIETITDSKLLKLIDKNELPSLNQEFKHRIDYDFYNDLEVELLEKYGKELSLSEQAMKQIGEYLKHLKALCEITKDNPPFMYQ